MQPKIKDLLRTNGWLDNKPAQTAMIVVSALVLCAGSFEGCSRVDTPESKPESKPATEAVVQERKLPSGNVCRVELHGLVSQHGIALILTYNLTG